MRANVLQQPSCVVIKIVSVLTMPLDINKYRKYVDDFDLTEEQKTELLQTVWSIMESFADSAFGLHPVQQCQGHPPEKDLQSHQESVKSKHFSNFIENELAPPFVEKNGWNRLMKEVQSHGEPK
jgi:hypothetical protein